MLRRLVLAAVATAALGGCAINPGIVTAVTTAESLVDYANAAWAKAGVTLFDVEATYGVVGKAAAEFEAKACPHKTSYSWCATLHQTLIDDDAVARAKFTAGEKYIAAHPTLSPQTVVNAAEAAVTAVASLVTSYGARL